MSEGDNLMWCIRNHKRKAPESNQLSDPQVRQILREINNKDTAIIDELYSFGIDMVEEASERYHRYDAKATKITGYAGAVTALLITGFPVLSASVDAWAVWFIVAGAFVALFSAFMGLIAISFSPISRYSPHDWIREDMIRSDSLECASKPPCKCHASNLRKYHISAMYTVRQSYVGKCKAKVMRIRAAHWALVFAGLLLLIAMGDGADKAVRALPSGATATHKQVPSGRATHNP